MGGSWQVGGVVSGREEDVLFRKIKQIKGGSGEGRRVKGENKTNGGG